MTVVAKHLRCDMRKICSQCSIYLRSPKDERKAYYYCAGCKSDILCDRGLIQNFIHEADGSIRKENLCMKCRHEVDILIWPIGSEPDMGPEG